MRNIETLNIELNEVNTGINTLVERERKHKTQYVNDFNQLIKRKRNIQTNINQLNQINQKR